MSETKVTALPPARAPAAVRDTLGRPVRDLRISVMDRCNFRCPYCMPAEQYHRHYRFLHAEERLGIAEIVRLARLFTQLGVRKLRLTGGEPLLRTDLAELVAELAAIGEVDEIALTTNGVLLAQQAATLAGAGLDRVTVSVDSLDERVFEHMSGGRGGLPRVLDGIAAAREAGLHPIKVNAVVQRGVNDGGVLDLLAHFRGTGVVVRLIEYMDVGKLNHWRREDVVPAAELLARIEARWPLRALAQSYGGEVAQRYEYADGQGEIGLITSVSQPFCGGCTRARLSSDGKLFTCLFAAAGTDLRGVLRAGGSDEELLGLIAAVWRARTDRYSEQRASLREAEGKDKVEMYYIGG
jgi:cyclic pyranopterin phosphate synthase